MMRELVGQAEVPDFMCEIVANSCVRLRGLRKMKQILSAAH
jgi:hypothetical protein